MAKRDQVTPSQRGRHAGRHLKRSASYILIGILLGLGAPAGSILFRYLSTYGSDVSAWFYEEWGTHRWYYLYMTIGTVTAFCLSASVVSSIHNRLKRREENFSLKARVLEEISEKDALTGIYNFASIQERLMIEIERAKRFQTPLSCLMIDVDELKGVNDCYGHPAGDQLLQHIAHLMRTCIRMIDIATRYGGDEFFILLPVTPLGGACRVAERLREKIKKEPFWIGKHRLPVSISLGAASFPAPTVVDLESLIQAADQALYQAKRSGKDQTSIEGEAAHERRN